MVGGQPINYRAVAGTLVVGATDPQDATIGFDGKPLPDSGVKVEDMGPTARMFYAAYFKKDATALHRPITFIYNGGPGSPTMWLHMGTFGPKRIVVPDTQHKEGAPYTIVSNEDSLLDVSDVVFIDAPGTGLSRTFGRNKSEAFYGVDADGHAFERFIRRFLSKYNRWNSPKYLFGESYGTPRSAVLAADLRSVDLNGVILLSQILSFDNSVDGPGANPGVDQAYALALPTMAATAWYHHKLPTQAAGVEAVSGGGGEVRAGRVHDGAAAGKRAAGGAEARGGGEAAWVHRAAGGLPAEGGPAGEWRGVFQGVEGRPGDLDGAAGLALPGAGYRSAEPELRGTTRRATRSRRRGIRRSTTTCTTT